MSKQLLKLALQRPEKVASSIARSLLSAAGSGLGAAGTFKLLSALRPELAEAALWGGVGAGGVLGHDVARHLANKAKVAAWAKKKAAMEKPFKTEYSLVKKAGMLDTAVRRSFKPSKLNLATYSALRGVPESIVAPTLGAGAVLWGALEHGPEWYHRALLGLAEPNPSTWDSTKGILTYAGTMLGGGALGNRAVRAVNKPLVDKLIMPRTAKYVEKGVDRYLDKLSSHTKEAGLSRAAKGAIGLPLGVMGAAALAPGHLFGDIGHLISGGAGKLADPTVGQKITEVLAGTGSRIGFNPHMNTDVAMLLGTAGLGGLGAGAGKLSERVIPVAKKSIMDNPTARKAAIAAALFPWSLAVGGGAYLLGKNSDS